MKRLALINRPQRSRRGMALLLVLAAIGIASVMGMSLLKLTIAQCRQAEREAFSAQARWLAESGVDRAAVALSGDNALKDLSWSIKAEELDGRHAGRVTVTIKSVESTPNRREVTAVAEFPTRTHQRARVTVTRAVDVSRQLPTSISSQVN